MSRAVLTIVCSSVRSSQSRRSARSGLVSLLPLLLAGMASAAPSAAPESLAAARTAWEQRARGFAGEWAEGGVIGVAVAAYEAALREAPASLEVHEELLRALYFQGTFTDVSGDQARSIFERGVAVSESAMRLLYGPAGAAKREVADLVAEAADQDRAGALHFWSAVLWGQWGDNQSMMAALRAGVATRVRDHGLVAMELDPMYDNAGPLRLLGRMHAVAPKVPMVTGWIDRDRAVELLERAHELAPADPQIRLFLVEVWLDRRPKKKAEAVDMLGALVRDSPRPGFEVEDSFVLRDASELQRTLGRD